MKIYIKTLTPVHIGTGREIEKFEYQVSNNQFSRINFSKLSDILMEKFPDKFTEWINKISAEENISKSFSLENINNEIAGNEKIDNEINRSIQYKLSTNTFPNKKIRENIKTGNNELYLPGTSIKGSIRTALLSNALTRISEDTKRNFVKKISSKLEKVKENFKDKEKIKKSICDIVENEIFYCGIEKVNSEGNKEIKYSDEKFDLMKFVLVSDSNSLKSEENGEISNLKMYKLKKTNGMPLVYSECISRSSYLDFEIRIDQEFILKTKELLNDKKNDFGKKEWINFKEKFERLYNIKLEDLHKGNIESVITDKILYAINEMGKNVYQKEKLWIDSLNENVGSQFIKNFYSNTNFENSMKVGYGSSFLATTIFIYMFNDTSLKTELGKVLKLFGIGKHTSGSKDDVNINSFPFTRKYESNNNEISPLGWVQLSKTEFVKNFEESAQGQLININKPIEKKENWYEAEIIKISPKPILIKILERDFKDEELKLQYGNISDLSIGKKLYITIEKNKKQRKDSKAKFEGFID